MYHEVIRLRNILSETQPLVLTHKNHFCFTQLCIKRRCLGMNFPRITGFRPNRNHFVRGGELIKRTKIFNSLNLFPQQPCARIMHKVRLLLYIFIVYITKWRRDCNTILGHSSSFCRLERLFVLHHGPPYHQSSYGIATGFLPPLPHTNPYFTTNSPIQRSFIFHGSSRSYRSQRLCCVLCAVCTLPRLFNELPRK